ncbi:MAG TPA: thiamine phosphate synthase [Dehalococcoidia bacterium]|nr:thiamine phosphate synthase [Dehalococcoidia bacterium]
MTENAGGLPAPTLMLVTDRRLAGGEDALVDAVAVAVESGVNAVQLREKDLPLAGLLALARRLREVTAGRALLLVNGPLEVALAAKADGVHLPEGAAPQGWGPEPRMIVGRSVHSLEAAVRAESDGADYLVAGTVYRTASHSAVQPSGLEIIRKVVSVARVPILGIGGITSKNAADVMRAGASGVAVISAILGAEFPGVAARELRDAVDGP